MPRQSIASPNSRSEPLRDGRSRRLRQRESTPTQEVSLVEHSPPPGRGIRRAAGYFSVSQDALILQRKSVSSTGFSHEFLKIAAVADAPFQICGQVIWYVYGKAAIPITTVKCIAGVSLAGFTKRAALSDAGTLPQGQRSNSHRPESLD